MELNFWKEMVRAGLFLITILDPTSLALGFFPLFEIGDRGAIARDAARCIGR
jgi:hypothetical protein